MNIYDDKDFYEAYSHMSRSEHGLSAAGEWYVLEKLFPDLQGLLDTGFVIEAVQEPQPQDPEKMPDEMRRPMMLLVKSRKKS